MFCIKINVLRVYICRTCKHATVLGLYWRKKEGKIHAALLTIAAAAFSLYALQPSLFLLTLAASPPAFYYFSLSLSLSCSRTAAHSCLSVCFIKESFAALNGSLASIKFNFASTLGARIIYLVVCPIIVARHYSMQNMRDTMFLFAILIQLWLAFDTLMR